MGVTAKPPVNNQYLGFSRVEVLRAEPFNYTSEIVLTPLQVETRFWGQSYLERV